MWSRATRGDGSSNLMVDEIGTYDGTTTLVDGTDLLTIDADGGLVDHCDRLTTVAVGRTLPIGAHSAPR